MKKNRRKRKSGPKMTASTRSPRQRLFFRVVALVATPVFFLLLAELFLRGIGYGIPSEFFVKWKSNGETVYIANEKYTQHFVPPALSRSPEFTAIRPKNDSTIRILVLGGSAANGDPDPAFGFCRLLERLLNAHSDGTAFEVINAAITSMNSHVARNIVRDSAGHGIDVFLVYMGNNEVVGPFGPSSVSYSLSSRPALLNAAIWLKKETRLGQMLKNLVQATGNGTADSGSWLGMEAFLENLVTHDDPRLEHAYRHYRKNLESIIDSARSQGALTLISTVPTNLRSSAPFASRHKAGLGAPSLEAWQSLFKSGREHEQNGDFEAALAEYERALKIDDEFADLLFSIARCQEGLGRSEEAKANYVRARDLDALRFRADSRINAIVRQVIESAAANDVLLLDLEKVIEDDAANGIPGARAFFDHVHLNFRGNFLAAIAAMDSLREALPAANISTVSKSIEELYEFCRATLLYDGVAEYQTLMTMYLRKTVPPFTGQLGHDAELARLKNQLIEDRSHLREYTFDLETQRQAVSNHPFDAHLLARYTESLVSSRRIQDALDINQKVLQDAPLNKELIIAYARLLVLSEDPLRALEFFKAPRTPFPLGEEEARYMLGTEYIFVQNVERAREVFLELHEISPDNIDYLINLGAASAKLGDHESERDYLERALELDPGSRQAMINYGNYFARQEQPEEAVKWFQKAVDAYPYEYLSQFGLGMQLLRTGEVETGVMHLSEAVKLKPDLVEAYHILEEVARQLENTEAAEHYSQLAEIFSGPIKPF